MRADTSTSSGLCACGCGQRTNPAPFTDRAKGYIKGEPVRFARGHHRRMPQTFAILDCGYKTPCHVWQGGRSNGYGQTHEGKLVHREVWESAFGLIPPGLFVCHHCDNPPCGRLDHLFLGTQTDNMRDAALKGRTHKPKPGDVPCGSAHWRTHLTEDDVRTIRRLAHQRIRQQTIADQFGISVPTVSDILHHRAWKHVTDDAA